MNPSKRAQEPSTAKVNRYSNLGPLNTKYFNNIELFEKFYNTFPHTVPVDHGDPRPLRASSINTNTAKVFKTKWSRKVRSNLELQAKIIKILEAEIQWREENDTLKYMNNIDTWLNNYNWEKYEYLLNLDIGTDMTKDI